jgi:hypothetical protein
VKRALFLTAALAMAACSTPQSRVKRHQAAFDAAPAAAQQKMLAGEVDIGFTPDQVLIALGDPERVYTRRSSGAATQEVWAYGFGRTGVGLGIGVFSGGPVSTGVSVGTSDDAYGEARTRVVFENGVVHTVEQRR